MPEKSLSNLDGKKLNDFSVKIGEISAGKYPEAANFELYLVNQKGESCNGPVVWGVFFGGRGKIYKPWIEIYFREKITFKSTRTLRLAETKLDEALFQELTELIPPGGHIMVIYVNHEETMRGLERGIPAPATPIGYLLWKAGCTWFKDWYFPEGGAEGDVKLQGEKPMDDDKRRKGLIKIREELTGFLRKENRYVFRSLMLCAFPRRDLTPSASRSLALSSRSRGCAFPSRF